MAVNPNTEISQKMQERFEFYMIALTFTLLGLSIQTASFGEGLMSDSFELSGWLLLFTSGLVGLSRLEWVPVAFNVRAKIEYVQTERANLHNMQEIGHTEIGGESEIVPIEKVIQDHDNAINQLNPQIEKIEKLTLSKYQIHKWSFVFGLLFLLLSRAYTPALKIVAEIFKST